MWQHRRLRNCIRGLGKNSFQLCDETDAETISGVTNSMQRGGPAELKKVLAVESRVGIIKKAGPPSKKECDVRCRNEPQYGHTLSL